MKKNHIIALSSLFTIILIIILVIVLKNYINNEREKYDLYNDYDRATIVYSIGFHKYANDYFENIRYQQRYLKSKKYTKMDLINDLKNYKFIDILNYIPNNIELTSLYGSLDKFVEYILYMNYYFNSDGAESCFTRNSNDKYYIEKDGKYIYEYTKKIVSLESLSKLFDDYIKRKGLSTDEYFFKILWKEPLIKSYYEHLEFGYDEMKKDIKTDYNTFYSMFNKIVEKTIVSIFDEYIEYLLNGIEVNEETDLISKILYPIELKTNEVKVDYVFLKVQPIFNDPTKYSNTLYGLDLEHLENQLSKKGYPLIFS